MIKILCITALIGFMVSCKTAKNYVVAKESYEVINVLGKHLGKRKEDQLYYKTYGIKYPPTYSEGEDWGIYVNFNQFSQNRIPGESRKGINFREYLTEEDLQYMREQIKNQTPVKWIKSRLDPNIKLYKDVKKVSPHAQLLMILNIYSEPVFSIDGRIALVYVITAGVIYMLISKKATNGNRYLLFFSILIERCYEGSGSAK